MIIRKMTATFGCLDHAVLEPESGSNCFLLPNEGGKSTWAAFVLAMFYGLENTRAAKGRLSGKERYAPWSGKSMTGAMELELSGRTVILQRSSENGKPFGVFRAWDKQTGITIDTLNGENCGRMLLGVEREVFRRTAFLSGGELTVTQEADLSRRLEQLAAAGRETDSFLAAEKRLRTWQNHLRYNRAGEIPKLSERLREAEAAEAALPPAAAQLPTEETLLRLLGRLEAMEERPIQIPPALIDVAEEEILTKAQRDLSRYKWKLALCGFFCVMFLVLAVTVTPLLSIGIVWAAAAGLVILMGRKLPQSYGVSRVRDVLPAAAECRDGQKYHRECGLVMETVSAFAPQADTLPAAKEAVEQAIFLRRKAAQQMSAEEKETLLAKLWQLERREQAIILARQALAQANSVLQQTYVPKLTGLAGEYLQALTAGRYDALVMNESMELSVRQRDGLLHPLFCVSKGTQDQTWLALRLAMTELLLPEGTPIILDDALLTFDKVREKAALELLANRERQVLCFSCR